MTLSKVPCIILSLNCMLKVWSETFTSSSSPTTSTVSSALMALRVAAFSANSGSWTRTSLFLRHHHAAKQLRLVHRWREENVKAGFGADCHHYTYRARE